MKQSGKQKMSRVKKTIQPAVPMRLAMTGGAVDWQCGQRKYTGGAPAGGANPCASGWTGAGGASVAQSGVPVKVLCGGGGGA